MLKSIRSSQPLGWSRAAIALLVGGLLAIAVIGTALAQDAEISLVNVDTKFVERHKDGGFIARPVFDSQLAFLAYAVRDPETGDWLTGVTQVMGGEKRLSTGWEYSWEYPGHSDQPDLEPERPYVLFMMGSETTPGDPVHFHAVIPRAPANKPLGQGDWRLRSGALGKSCRALGNRGSPRDAVRSGRARHGRGPRQLPGGIAANGRRADRHPTRADVHAPAGARGLGGRVGHSLGRPWW